MVKLMHLKNDWKQIFREPIMMILFLCPLLIAVVFRLLTAFLLPMVFARFNAGFIAYEPYVLALVLILCSMMLGVVMGFLMMDDKDAKIIELMSCNATVEARLHSKQNGVLQGSLLLFIRL